ncbi:Branched-chain amino acid transport system / permease component [Acididesulfobacillus acetoxydans]|uniref:Branched-chain amino acid transport system / permease component n=1 Tax=Acididesulfobacillus acetoxydans TaxID=1561005 RepID=A0A8S0WL35_9FIRM|nr:branched-chain amino acid ABC transporter permease [Acididesulfobacillus acetoxydans]CAA7599804.1 Branched-chain amino acid transport system / permease component [Acididesulfobacillus acetoxydans]CEJ07370.1 Inner-membrane translocator [Acididesulfobacillus acetoxydans]
MKVLNKKNLVILLAVLVVYGGVQAAIAARLIPPFYSVNLMLICVYVILATSLNLINGVTGQFSIGHAGFMAIGAYLSAIVSVKLHGPLGAAILAGGIVSAAVGFLVGLPTLRLKGDYLAITTLGVGQIVQVVFFNTNYVGGAAGFTVPRTVNWTWAFWLTVISVVIIHNFTNSTHGRACISVRENEIAAEAMGINSTKYKVMAFTLGSFLGGLAGGLYANYMYLIQPTTFSFLTSFNILVMVVLGGLGSMTGSIVGAVVMTVLSAYLSQFPEWRMVLTALLLIVVMLFRPSGLLGTKEFNLGFLGKKGESRAA